MFVAYPNGMFVGNMFHARMIDSNNCVAVNALFHSGIGVGVGNRHWPFKVTTSSSNWLAHAAAAFS